MLQSARLATFAALAVAAAATAPLAGCATLPDESAARDVRALVVALQTRDRAGIEQGIDRPALTAQMAGAARALVARETGAVLGNSTAGLLVGLALADAGEPVIQAVVRRALEPDVLADLAALGGLETTTRLPSAGQTRLALRRMDDGRTCLPASRSGPCNLIFAQSAEGRWRLSAINPDILDQGLARQLPRR
jgi:hypothetical protein